MDCSLPGASACGIFQARIWSGLPFPSPGDLRYSGIKPTSSALEVDSLPLRHLLLLLLLLLHHFSRVRLCETA